MVISLVQNTVKWLNTFPSKDGISEEMSSKTIVTGASKPDFNRKRIPFGGYAMVYTGIYLSKRNIYILKIKESIKIQEKEERVT